MDKENTDDNLKDIVISNLENPFYLPEVSSIRAILYGDLAGINDDSEHDVLERYLSVSLLTDIGKEFYVPNIVMCSISGQIRNVPDFEGKAGRIWDTKIIRRVEESGSRGVPETKEDVVRIVHPIRKVSTAPTLCGGLKALIMKMNSCPFPSRFSVVHDKEGRMYFLNNDMIFDEDYNILLLTYSKVASVNSKGCSPLSYVITGQKVVINPRCVIMDSPIENIIYRGLLPIFVNSKLAELGSNFLCTIEDVTESEFRRLNVDSMEEFHSEINKILTSQAGSIFKNLDVDAK